MSAESSPILDFFSLILSPVIWVMDLIFSFYESILHSPGLSVILLSITMALVCWPFQKYGKAYEDRLREKISVIDEELAPFKAKLKGEKLFNEVERIYTKHKYHPIHSVGLSMSFIVVLPILISAIILLSQHELLIGQKFLFVPDLSKADQLLGPVNLLPIVMTGITVFDAFHRFKDDKKTRTRFLIIAAVLFALIYTLPSALVVYWTTNVTLSMFLSFKKQAAAK